jgi:hypothetical protein
MKIARTKIRVKDYNKFFSSILLTIYVPIAIYFLLHLLDFSILYR